MVKNNLAYLKKDSNFNYYVLSSPKNSRKLGRYDNEQIHRPPVICHLLLELIFTSLHANNPNSLNYFG